jgi:hypothetical protein
MAILIACLDQLFDEIDALAPDRDTSSDGWIGDASHAGSSSDHNPDESGNTPYEDADSIDEVHAIDVDETTRADVSMAQIVDHILDRCRSGEERRLHYIIYERTIYEDDNDWEAADYYGSNAHDKHAHFSACYETDRESDRSPWLEGLMGLTSSDKDWIDGEFRAYVGDVVDRWTAEGGRVPADDANPKQTVPSALFYGGADGAHIRYVQLEAIQQQLEQLTEMVRGLTGQADPAGVQLGEG